LILSSGCTSLPGSDDDNDDTNSDADDNLRVEMSWDAYIHPDNMHSVFLNLSNGLPEHTQVVEIGRSYEGRQIWALRISGNVNGDFEIQKGEEGQTEKETIWEMGGEGEDEKNRKGGGREKMGKMEKQGKGEEVPEEKDDATEITMIKPMVLMVGGHHGQEWMALMPPLYFAWNLINGYGNNETFTTLVDTRDIWIIPILNTDGMAYDMDQGAADWRKNRQPNPDGSIGTDLNRNYPWHWGEPGMNTPIPSTTFYQGPPDFEDNDGDLLIDEDKVDGIDNDLDGEVDEDRNGGFSAPETKALGTFVTEHTPVLALSFHTAGAQILYPWSYSYDETPDDALFQAMAQEMAALTGYEPMQGSDLYPSAGEWGDYMYGVHNTYAFTIELLDQSGGDEYAPPEMIQPTVDLVLPLQIAVTQWADDPNQVLD